MILSFADQGTQDVFNGIRSKKARRVCPEWLWGRAAYKLEILDQVKEISDLAVISGNRLELLSGDREGQYSIRINRQYRICFFWTDNGPLNTQIIDYH